MTKAKLTRRIFFSLDRQLRIARLGADIAPENELPEDMVNAIGELIDEAFAILETEGSGYDPRADARPMAEQAVIIYVKSAILGMDPTQTSSFQLSANQWTKSAARAAGRNK